jgi:hypothetical protein
MKKNNLIIFGSISLFIILGLFLFFILMKKNQVQNQPVAKNPAILPSQSESNPQNVQAVEKTIDVFVNEPVPEKVIQERSDLVEFKNQDKKAIPLIDFEKATGIIINKDLRNQLDNTDYRMFYCPGVGNKKDFGVYLGYNVKKAYNQLYPDTIGWMKSWEKTIFSDLHTILFPDINFSKEELSQQLQFKDGKYRYTEFKLPNGRTGSMNYHVSDNGVIITTTPSCMDNLIQIYEPLQP